MTAPSGPTFALLPAIDLIDGRVVRLTQGDFDRTRVYDDDPVSVAASFARIGAPWLHVVDLDGARLGAVRQGQAIARIIDRVWAELSVEIAGGIRSRAEIDVAFGTGADRIVLGTAVLREPALASWAVDSFGAERIVAAIDVRSGSVVGEGWRQDAIRVALEETVDRVTSTGIRIVEVTAIDRDGLMGGPDLGLLRTLTARGDVDVIASGGIRSVDDLTAVREAGCVGAIVGRALYEGVLDLRDALAAVA